MNNTNPFQEIKTDRLLLRRLKESDWEVIRFLRSDKTVNKFVKRPTAETKKKALAFIAKINEGIDMQQLYQWGISLHGDSFIIGSICLWNFSRDGKTAEVGYELSPAFHGKGIMDETIKSVLVFGFKKLGLDQIDAFTNKENRSSQKLLLRNRFRINKDRKDKEDKDNLIFEIKKIPI